MRPARKSRNGNDVHQSVESDALLRGLNNTRNRSRSDMENNHRDYMALVINTKYPLCAERREEALTGKYQRECKYGTI